MSTDINLDIIMYKKNNKGKNIATIFLSTDDVSKIEIKKKVIWKRKVSKEADKSRTKWSGNSLS